MADDIAEQFEERMTLGLGRGARQRGRGGRGGARGRETDISRAMSRLLRHQAESAGVPLDAEGFAPLDQVVSPLDLHPPPAHG